MASRSRCRTKVVRWRCSSELSGSMTVLRVASQDVARHGPATRRAHAKRTRPLPHPACLVCRASFAGRCTATAHATRRTMLAVSLRFQDVVLGRPLGQRRSLTPVSRSTQADPSVTQSLSTQMAPEGSLSALQATIDRARGSRLYAERLAGVHLRSLDDLRALPITTRADLQRAGPHGTRAVPLEEIAHYGEASGTSGATNSMWLTARDFERDARVLRARHPDVFAPGRIILNRFPFMAAPAHLIQV